MNITLREISEAVGGKIISGSPELLIRNITTSSKEIKGDDIFVPVKGANTDGHKYIASAFDGGAAASFMSDPGASGDLSSYGGKGIILVSDTVGALQAFGAYYRRKYVKIPYIGVTGSVGKTTTREMIACALRGGLRTYSTKGNANSQIGVPITVTETDPDAEIGVIELGISMFGEMEKISSLTACDTCVMTKVGVSHIENFHTQENILKEKLKILSGSNKDTVLFVNGDDDILKDLTEEMIHGFGIATDRKIEVRYYGTGENSSIRAENIVKTDGIPSFDCVMGDRRIRVNLSVRGDHMVLNSLCAMGLADYYGVPVSEASEMLSGFAGVEGRGNHVKLGPAECIYDCYNAAPESVRVGLGVLMETPCRGRRIAVLADMLELGNEQERCHREVGEMINSEYRELDALYTYGDLARLIYDRVTGIRKEHFDDFESLKERLYSDLRDEDLVIIKGSNGMRLGRLLS